MADSVEFLANERDDAARRLHWHLSKAALHVLSGCALGPPFEAEMLLAERARQDWHNAQDAIFRSEPAHGG